MMEPGLNSIGNNLDIDPRLIPLSQNPKFIPWLMGGLRKVCIHNESPLAAFSLLIGGQLDVDGFNRWEDELVRFFTACGSKEQKTMRDAVLEELENVHTFESEGYAVFLLGITKRFGIIDALYERHLSLVRDQFPNSQEIFASVLLSFCSLKSPQKTIEVGNSSLSEELIAFMTQDPRYNTSKYGLHLYLALIRKESSKILAHTKYFPDLGGEFKGMSPQRRGSFIQELRRLAEKGHMPIASIIEHPFFALLFAGQQHQIVIGDTIPKVASIITNQ